MKKSKQVILWLFVALVITAGVGMTVAMLFFPEVFAQRGIILALQIVVGVPLLVFVVFRGIDTFKQLMKGTKEKLEHVIKLLGLGFGLVCFVFATFNYYFPPSSELDHPAIRTVAWILVVLLGLLMLSELVMGTVYFVRKLIRFVKESFSNYSKWKKVG